jgi:HEAT repeat protein
MRATTVAIALTACITASTASAGLPAIAQERVQSETLSPADLKAAIDQLSAVDCAVRMDAARKIRRTPAAQAVPALLRALGQESAEFVRPALLRALAAHGRDPKVRDALLPEIARGETMFRSALIEALGDYHADSAVAPLIETAQMDGPLQVDAAIALGKIGDRRALNALVAAQRAAPEDVQPQIAASICLLGVNCSSHAGYIDRTLRFTSKNAGFQPQLRSAAAAAGALGQAGRADAVNLLFDVGVVSEDPVRAPIALALGAVALRNTPLVLSVLEKRGDRDPAILLLRDAFDMLEEPYEKERFFVAVRHAYWQAAKGSEPRRIAQLLIERLEF